jgi:tungstate transport system substrate-binding protein
MHGVGSLLALGLLVAAAPGGEAQRPEKRDVIVATTTSTQDSGLMDLLVPMFERQSGYRVKLISAGTGQSLTMGARGDADVVLGHAPELEEKYVAQGAFVNRRLVMYNDFVVVGPPADPLKIRGMRRLAEVFQRIAEAQATFISRADQSGTHIRELALWERAGVKPGGAWYVQTGQGQGATLNIASEKHGYALTDRGTYLALRRHLALEIVFEKARPLLNIYHVMEINPGRHPRVNLEGGRAFADFLVSPAAQAAIAAYGADKYGQPLFFAAAGKQVDQLEAAGPAD